MHLLTKYKLAKFLAILQNTIGNGHFSRRWLANIISNLAAVNKSEGIGYLDTQCGKSFHVPLGELQMQLLEATALGKPNKVIS